MLRVYFTLSILVLKDGQIVEQGSHKELLALNGVFASMWADQISASDEPVIVVGETVTAEVPGYSVENVEPAPTPAVPEEDTLVDVGLSEDVPVEAQTTLPEIVSQNTDASLVAFPSEDPPSTSQDEAPTEIAPMPAASADTSATGTEVADKAPAAATTPGVTFSKEVDTPPRTGTPDPDSEPKRKRISSQNFQRLARRISITTRRTGSSSSIPIISGLKRSESPRGSSDGGTGDSPTSSTQGESDKGKKKKDKRKSIL
jgi:hypothetical protein